MQLDSGWIEYHSGETTLAAYRVRPAAAAEPLPGVLVIQEVWGPDAHICDIAERLAAAGYLALAPDLYSHGGRPAELERDRIEAAKEFLDALPVPAWMDPALRAQALAEVAQPARGELAETLGALLAPTRPLERYVADLCSAVRYLVDDEACSGRVGSIGFCLGGGLSARLAAAAVAPTLAGAVVYYGSAPPACAGAIGCPVQAHYGGEDERVNAGVAAFAAAMAQARKSFEHHFYDGAPHAFMNDTRSSYRADAARTAWARTLTFLAGRLGSQTVGAS